VKLVPLAGRAEDAVRNALLSHGWEGDLSRSTADSLELLTYHLTDAEPATLEALVRTGSRLGVDVITGDDWALLSGPRARLSALARPWTGPEPLAEFATALGHALPSDDPRSWHTARGTVSLEQPVIIGILNLTPDSFSDGGQHAGEAAALARAETLLEGGAGVIDVGGESTRPGAVPVSVDEELTRVIPLITMLARRLPEALISIDTTKAAVARAALDAGAAIVNDVSGLRHDAALAELCAERRAGVILMHSRGAPGELTASQRYPGGVLAEVATELGQAVARARRGGVPAEALVVDPGLGFGKSPEESVELLSGLGALRVLGRPLLVGPSRKRFLGALTDRPVEQRDVATAAACALAWETGARLFRVHEPAVTRDALRVARAIRPR